jgi:hypothetical protein
MPHRLALTIVLAVRMATSYCCPFLAAACALLARQIVFLNILTLPGVCLFKHTLLLSTATVSGLWLCVLVVLQRIRRFPWHHKKYVQRLLEELRTSTRE